MQIVKPYAKMMPPIRTVGAQEVTVTAIFHELDGLALLRHVEWCARISHRSEEAVTPESWRRLLQSVVIDHGDWSVTEHASVSCDFYVDRGITHELVRHRLFAFTQESTRFVNYAKKMLPSFIEPELVVSLGAGKETDHLTPNQKRSEALSLWADTIHVVEAAYQRLLALGFAPQIARSLFVNALASRIIITGNLRNWRHFFLMRTSKESHPQMREVTIPLLAEFKSNIPLLYDDIEPEARQVDNLRKGR